MFSNHGVEPSAPTKRKGIRFKEIHGCGGQNPKKEPGKKQKGYLDCDSTNLLSFVASMFSLLTSNKLTIARGLSLGKEKGGLLVPLSLLPCSGGGGVEHFEDLVDRELDRRMANLPNGGEHLFSTSPKKSVAQGPVSRATLVASAHCISHMLVSTRRWPSQLCRTDETKHLDAFLVCWGYLG